ncbi:MAG: TetR/AcrR family transcriptional regulator [Nocardioidaceae bacterium]|nr:TetR/AcrR family transcriptional regulator [Nocardioidaceae bacterium]
MPVAGRRRGSPDTRGEILDAARREFSVRGFDGTSMRAVAREADVDPALVHHYFSGKDDLFLAAMELPFDPRAMLPPVLRGPRDGTGERLLRAVLGLWDDPDLRPRLLTVLRSALASDDTAHLLRDGLLRLVIEQIATLPGVVDPQRRGALVGSQVIGLIIARHVLGLEPLASMTAHELAAVTGPTLDRYLYGDDLR